MDRLKMRKYKYKYNEERQGFNILILLVIAVMFIGCIVQPELGTVQQDNNIHIITTNNNNDYNRGQLNILALGGSKTWGTGVGRPKETYPHLLGKYLNATRSDNLGIPASGSQHPAMCVQSMIRDHYNNEEEGDGISIANEIVYDVVLLEFSTNDGLSDLHHSLKLLARRIRLRYPNALMIYIHTYHFGGYVEDLAKYERRQSNNNPMVHDNNNNRRPFVYDGPRFAKINHVIVDEVGGMIYKFPTPNSVEESVEQKQWFQDDMHHFSKKGHVKIALDLKRIITEQMTRMNLDKHPPRDDDGGRWGRGDNCYSWYQTGKVPLNVKLSGGTMSHFTPFKYAYEVSSPSKTATLEFPSNEGSVIYLNYMTIGSIQQYPRVDISGLGIESRSHVRPEDIPGNWHISRIVNLGVATSDRIVLSVTPTEVKELPFRIIGVSACPACEDMGNT